MADYDCTTSIYPPVYTKATLQAAFLHTCPVCGDRFSVEGRRGPKGSATYCSRTCWSIGNAKDDGNLLRVDDGTPVYRCLHCEAEFTGRKRKYCGDECADKAKSKRRSAKQKRTRSFKSIRRPNPIIDGMRVCIDCSHNLPLSEYTILKCPNCKSGESIRGVCKSCERKDAARRAKKRTTEQRQAERTRIAARRNRKYTPGGPGIAQTLPLSVWQSRLAKQNARQAWDYWMQTLAPDEWMQFYCDALGEPWRNPRLTDSERYRIRYRLDAQFNLSERIRNQIKKKRRRARTGEHIRSAFNRGGRCPSLEKQFGYTIPQLRKHLERQFTKGMTWDRFLTGEIHIDHIHPQSEFDLSDDDQWRKCWCLSNLRPMWGSKNCAKGNRIQFLL